MNSGPINFYTKIPKELMNQKSTYKNYNKLKIEVPCFGLISGSTGSMKSNSLLYLIHQIAVWDRFFLFTKQPNEPLYRYLSNCINKVE